MRLWALLVHASCPLPPSKIPGTDQLQDGWLNELMGDLFGGCLEQGTKSIVGKTRNACVAFEGRITLDARSVIHVMSAGLVVLYEGMAS